MHGPIDRLSVMPLQSLPPIAAAPLVREVDEALIPLLRGLDSADWQRQAVGVWTVRDVAAHLLDGALRRLSLDRDGHQPPSPDRDLSDYGELVEYLNELNASWVTASQRLSPEVITDLLENVCPQMADYFESLDGDGEAAFPVTWAGEAASRVWMDIAREFTERWHHQQQIREAVGAPLLDQERFVRPLLETFMRALPRSFASLVAPEATSIEIRISDMKDIAWLLQRQVGGWQLGPVDPDLAPDVSIRIPAATAWRLFTKGISAAQARSSTKVLGPETLADPFFTTLAIMA
jgi:uncharacterized protein (TIGR03083 family)